MPASTFSFELRASSFALRASSVRRRPSRCQLKRRRRKLEAAVASERVRIPFTISAPGTRPFDVVGFGLNSMDLLTVVAEFPVSNSKQRLQRVARMPGGQTATALVTCARLGWRARYIGSFGDDEFGTISRQSLIDEQVDISAARIVAGATNQFAVVVVDARTGERTVLWDRHPALTMAAEDVPQEAVTSGRVRIVLASRSNCAR